MSQWLWPLGSWVYGCGAWRRIWARSFITVKLLERGRGFQGRAACLVSVLLWFLTTCSSNTISPHSIFILGEGWLSNTVLNYGTHVREAWPGVEHRGRLPEEGTFELGFEDWEGVKVLQRRALSKLSGRPLGSWGQEEESCLGGAERKVLERWVVLWAAVTADLL